MPEQFSFFALLSKLLYLSMTVGYLTTFVIRLKEKNYKEAALLFIPFYVIKSILSMKESHTKKLLSISVMGALMLWIIIKVITIVLTPPI